MEIQDLNQEIRNKYLKKMGKKSARELSSSWSGEDLLYSGKGNAIFIILPTTGCSWALSESGGCTMCSYITDSPLEKVENGELVDIFREIINEQEIKPKTAVKIFVSGSFLNEEEISKEVRNTILKILDKEKYVEEVVVESRPEYVTTEVLLECCTLLPDKTLEVSIGLESSSDHIKKYRINKGLSNKDFERAIKTIKDLKPDYNIKAKAYLLVKPILTSEKEAIEDAVRSAVYAEKVGVDRLSFCPATIHKGTLMEVLWRRGSYQPPWMWSILEIIRKVKNSVEIPVIMDTAGFGTRRGPYNCKKCNSRVKNLIIESNLDQTLPPEFDCECKKQWRVDLELSKITHSTTNLTKKIDLS